MTHVEDLSIAQALSSELGAPATFSLCDRSGSSPMTSVLDEVEMQIGTPCSVYWVDAGLPEVVTLSGFSSFPIIFSARYLALTSLIRRMLVQQLDEELVADVAERAALKVVAEMALRHGDPDFAVVAFIKSLLGKAVWLCDNDQIMGLEYAPKDEAYMCTWFFGMVHELGHFHPEQRQQFREGILSDAEILDIIKLALDSFRCKSEMIQREALERARQQRSGWILGIDQVRSEALADMFAARVLLKTTAEVMRKSEESRFEIGKFIQEMNVFLYIDAVIARCRRAALVASGGSVDRASEVEEILQPVSVMVRALMQREYLDLTATGYLFSTEDPTEEQVEVVTKMSNEIGEMLAATVHTVDRGVARAMAFSYQPRCGQDDFALLDALQRELPESELGLLEASRFCQLADMLRADGQNLRALKYLVRADI